jgi:hypothetical protein
MIELYRKLSEYDVIMSMKADNEYQIVHIQFEKGATHRCFVYTYDTACDPIRWERILLGHLGEFMFIYEQECIKMNRARDLSNIKKYLKKRDNSD